MPVLLHSASELNRLPHEWSFYDDFLWFTDTEFWTETSPDAGASVARDADSVGGILELTTGATDNNEAYVESPECFLVAENKPIIARTRVNFTEANTDDANVIWGLWDAPAADDLVDNGGGPRASYHGFTFFKVDGGTLWQVEVSTAASQETKTTDVTAGGGWQTLEIRVVPISSTDAEVIFLIDSSGGQHLRQVAEDGANPRTPLLKFTYDYSSTTELAMAFGVKAGDANSEVLKVDYAAGAQVR